VPAHLLQRHVDVVRPGEVARGPDEPVVVQDVEDAADRHQDVVVAEQGLGVGAEALAAAVATPAPPALAEAAAATAELVVVARTPVVAVVAQVAVLAGPAVVARSAVVAGPAVVTGPTVVTGPAVVTGRLVVALLAGGGAGAVVADVGLARGGRGGPLLAPGLALEEALAAAVDALGRSRPSCSSLSSPRRRRRRG
jgi:hypothetical protein